MRIGTHSGHFHADEALAVYMLKLLPKFSNAEVVRSRDINTLETCDIVVDVGGKYEPLKWLDHHQREFTTTFDAEHSVTKLSSAGLVYKHFGREVLHEILNPVVQSLGSNGDKNKKRKLSVSDIVDKIYVRLYEKFIEAVDAMDNGVNAYTEKPKYDTHGMTIQALVNNLSPPPYEEVSDEKSDSQFKRASEIMGLAFECEVKSAQLGWYFSRETVGVAFADRFKYDPEGRILVLDDMASWKEHLYTLEENHKDQNQVLYVLYPSGDSFRVQAVAKEAGSFESRKALPEQWRGLRDSELSAVTGVENGVFVHASGFIGGNKTREGAILMAQKAVN